jgi:hypothetical protein
MFWCNYSKVVSTSPIEALFPLRCLITFEDEPDEVGFVKKALSEHLDMDPPVTLGVLCDQIVPPHEPMDDEELQIRDRLRSLVISFLTGEAKRAILRHANRPGSEAEAVLVNQLLVVRFLST